MAEGYVIWDWTEQRCRLVSSEVFATRADAKKYCEGTVSLAIERLSYTPLHAHAESLVLLNQVRKAVKKE